MERVKCAICGSEDYNAVLTAEDYRLHTTDEKFNLVRCRQCGLVYVNPRPTKGQIEKFYPAEYYKKLGKIEKAVVNFLHSYRAKGILKIKKLKNGKILDVGCGNGGFLLSVQKYGWDTYGIEVSEDALGLARMNVRKNIFNCELKKCIFPSSYFDVITLWHVLEHLPDPSSELVEINRILKEDGYLVVCVPNINSFQFKIFEDKWFNLDIPRHLYHFSPRTLGALLKKTGFKITKFDVSIEIPLDWYHSILSSIKSQFFRRSIVILLPFTIFLFFFSVLSSIFNKGTSLEVYCKKIE